MLLYILLSAAFKIRLYHRDLYLGLLPDRDAVPTMVNYEICQRFETEFIDLYSEQSFIFVKGTTNYCLDVGRERGNQLLYWSHHGGSNQRWTIVHGKLNAVRIKYEDLCLEYLPDDDVLRMQSCNESENQFFDLIEDEDEDHGLATQINVTNTHDLDNNALHGGQSLGYGKSYQSSWAGHGGMNGSGGSASGGWSGGGGSHGSVYYYENERVESLSEDKNSVKEDDSDVVAKRIETSQGKDVHQKNGPISDSTKDQKQEYPQITEEETDLEESNTGTPLNKDGNTPLEIDKKTISKKNKKEHKEIPSSGMTYLNMVFGKQNSGGLDNKSKCGDWDFHDKGHHPEMQAYYDHGHGSAPA